MQKINVVDLDSWFNEKDEIEPAEENKDYDIFYADGRAIGRHYVINKEE